LLFIGVSESLMSSGLPVTSLAPAVYAHQNATTKLAAAPTRRKRVVCVDDSPTILGMLKRILEPEFEIVGTAANGIEAARIIPTLKPDIVTLDIHMPEQNGIEYLTKNFGPGHPPVIVVSSVPREDSSQAMKCLELGARDYIEKPELADLQTRTDEIRTKLNCAIQTVENEPPGVLEIERSFQSEVRIERAEQKLRVIFAGAADRGKLPVILRECTGAQPPTVILLEGSKGLLPSLAQSVGGAVWDGKSVLEVGRVYFADFASTIGALANAAANRTASILMLGLPTDAYGKSVANFPKCEILLEDTGAQLANVTRGRFTPTYFVPHTSMAYHSNKYLCTI
jgi:chemotaxis protein methyltransferase CheR